MFNFVCNSIDFAHKLDRPSSPTEEYHKHIHSFYEILYLVKGNTRYTVESETQTLQEGDLVLITPGKYHFATVDLSVPYERYVFKFPESEVPEFLRARLSESQPFYMGSKKFSAVLSQFDSYAQLFSPEETYVLFTSELKKMLIMLCHEMTAMPSSKHNDFIGATIAFIDANLRGPITMQMLSDEFHYSKSFINIEFKRHMRIPIMQYVRSKKIMAAHQMILSGAKKSEAAEAYGFDTYSTFYRAYRKLMSSENGGGDAD